MLHKAWYPLSGGQSWHQLLMPWPKINRIPPLIMNNLDVKFESDWAITVANCNILPTRFNGQECQSWPLTPWPKCKRIPPLIANNLHVKFESDWAKTVACIVPTSLTKCQNWPLTALPKIRPLIMDDLCLKFESGRAKTVVCIVPTRIVCLEILVTWTVWFGWLWFNVTFSDISAI